jgi:hypothetical protein
VAFYHDFAEYARYVNPSAEETERLDHPKHRYLSLSFIASICNYWPTAVTGRQNKNIVIKIILYMYVCFVHVFVETPAVAN